MCDLLGTVQCSEVELQTGLKDLQACEINGKETYFVWQNNVI